MEEPESKSAEPELVAAWVLSGFAVTMLFAPTMLAAIGMGLAVGGGILGIRQNAKGPVAIAVVVALLLVPALGRYLG